MLFFEIKTVKDLIGFMDWLEEESIFPIEFYLCGVVYKLKDEQQKLFFCVGAEAIFNIIGELYENL